MFPFHARAEEGTDEHHLLEVEEAQGERALDQREVGMHDSWRHPHARLDGKPVAPQPAGDPVRRELR